MRSPIPLVWIAVLALLLLPTAAGRLLLDVAGGLILVVLALPVILGGVGWIGWKLLQSRMRTCPACGTVSFATAEAVRCAELNCRIRRRMVLPPLQVQSRTTRCLQVQPPLMSVLKSWTEP